jgi:hypothetical protein
VEIPSRSHSRLHIGFRMIPRADPGFRRLGSRCGLCYPGNALAKKVGTTAVVDAKRWPPVHSKISDHSPHGLQVWHVYVEVHPIDRFKLKHNMVTQYIRHRSCYAHSGVRSSTGLATHRASSSYVQGIVPAGSIGVHLSLAIAINAPSSAYTSSV